MKSSLLKKGFIVVLTLCMTIVFASPLVAGGRADEPDEDEIVIRYWHHEAPEHRIAAFERVNQMFEEENPGVRMEQEVVMWGDAWTRSFSALEAGTIPDFQFSIPDLTLSMYQAGALAPVTDLVEELDAAYSFYPAQKNIYAHDGEYWGVPIFTMIMTLMYRPSLVEEHYGISEIPEDWDWNDVLEAAAAITENSGEQVYGMGVGAGRNLMTSEQIYVFLRGAGADIFDEQGNVVFDNPQTVEALEMYDALFQYTPPGAEAWSWGEIELNIAAGTLAISPYFTAVQKRLYEEFDSTDLAAAHMPFFPGRDERGTLTYPNDIHVYQNTVDDPERYEIVKDFIRFIMRPDVNAELTAIQEPGTFYPTTEDAADAPEYWNDPIVSAFEEVHRKGIAALEYANLYGFEHGRWVNLGIGDMTGADILAETIHNVVTGEMTAEEAAAWGAKEMEQYSVPVN